MVDSESGIKSTYYYDLIDRLCRYEEAGQDYSFIMEYEFNDRNQVSQMVQTIDGNRRPIEITYDDDGRVTSYRKAEVTESYGYDNLGRLATKTTALDTATRLTETLTYRTNSSGNETGQVNTMSINAPSGYHIYFTYGYDMNGNIAFVKSGDMTTNYTYDSAGQLIREDNQAQGKSWTWVYDNAGNILSKKEYAYTTGTLGTATDTVSYVYDTGSWGDLLTSFDGQAITYDAIGNPTRIGNRTFTWKHGRELATLTENGVTWTNTYNADGLRISRTNGTLTYQYYYADGQLVRIGVGSKYLDISYDASGVPMALYYSGYQVDNAHYYYVTNLQGDVVAILDDNGTAVVTYTYDAWGNILSVGGSMAATLGVYNPLRYRGYVYDQETSLYYLQSRYYDPNMGRFLNADVFVSTGQGFGGNNMFAYCNNNPVNAVDSSGMAIGWIIAGVIISVISNGISTAVTGGSAKEVFIDAAWGGVTEFASAISGRKVCLAVADGVYSAINAWGDGASFGGGIACGTISAATSLIPGGDTGDLLVDCFVDSTFGIGKDMASAGIEKGIIVNGPGFDNPTSSFVGVYYYRRGSGGKENSNLVNSIY